MSTRGIVIAGVLLLAGPPAFGQRHGRLIARIDSLAGETLRRGAVPGLSLAVSRGKETILARGYGATRLSDSTPATEHTVYPIASITKQFTAAAILRLIERKRLKLTDPAARYLAAGEEPDDPVTVRHLLNHLSGLQSMSGLDGLTVSDAPVDPAAVVEYFRDAPAPFKPGTHFVYSNTGYYLLGAIIERVTGQAYREFLRDSLIRPLGLGATGECAEEPLPVPGFSAGGLCSNVVDLVTWGRALEDRKVFNNLSWHQMIEPAELKDGSRASYGFGVTLGRLDKHLFVGHGGATPGFSSQLAIYPDDQVVVAILANSDEALTRRLADQVARLVLGIPEPIVKDLALPVDAATLYDGTYRLVGDSARITVRRRGDRLAAQLDAGEPMNLLYQGGHEFAAETDPTTRLFFRPSGGRANSLDLVTGDLRATAHITGLQ